MESANFTNIDFPLGEVRQNTTYHVVFGKKPDGKVVSSLSGTCGCTSIDNNDGYVAVQYKTAEIPVELVKQGVNEMPQEKTITVTFKDGSTETLTITATIKR